MPLYEYECKECGHQFEQLVSISNADKQQTCPKCGGKDTQKLFSAFSTKSSGSSSSLGVSGGGGFT